ncbi:MAG TPA: aldo/keto reductase [Microthrixaceae bacterium]|nr:aldo/keto reductase [Microthrixaceae bacterium]
MQSRELGTTGLMVTPLGLGLAALGRPGYINLGHGADFAGHSDSTGNSPAKVGSEDTDGTDASDSPNNFDSISDSDKVHDIAAASVRAGTVLDAARDLGIGYYDAARSYGRAEEFLADWLDRRAIRPGELTVGSKWGYTYTADWQVQAEHHEVKDHSLQTLRRQHVESTATLGQFLDLYQVHSATLESGVLDDDSVLDELASLAESGLVVGLSTSGPQQSAVIRKAIGIERSGVRVFSTIQSTWNILERSAESALAEAHSSGLGVIIKEALANGRLTKRNQNLPAAVANALRSTEASFDQMALAFVMAQSFVDVTLSGAATVEQLRSNAAALELVDDFDQEIFADLSQPPEEYWQDRSRLPWN